MDLDTSIKDAAARAVAGLAPRAGSALDYSPASLALVDTLLGEASELFDELPHDRLLGLVQQIGSYVLVVAQGQFGGTWYWDEEEDQPILVVGEPHAHIALMTWNKVLRRLQGDPAEDIAFFYEGFAARAGAPQAGEQVLFE